MKIQIESRRTKQTKVKGGEKEREREPEREQYSNKLYCMVERICARHSGLKHTKIAVKL